MVLDTKKLNLMKDVALIAERYYRDLSFTADNELDKDYFENKMMECNNLYYDILDELSEEVK